MFKRASAKFVIKTISVLILTLMFSSSFFFDTAGPPWAYAATTDSIFTDNVGIGTTNPIYRLDVSGDIYSDGTIFGNISSASGTSTLNSLNLSTLTVTGASYLATTSGNVGIGTTGPASLLHLIGGNLTIGSGVGDTQRSITIYGNGTDRPFVKFLGQNSGQDLTIYGKGSGSIRPALITTAYGLELSYATSATEEYGFRVNQNTTPVFQILNGNVGIGTTGPSQKLDISGSIRIDGTGRLDLNKKGGTNISINSNGSYWGTIQNETVGDKWSLGYTSNANNLGIPVLTWTDGNVGIGTTEPAYKLDVSGDIRVNDILSSDADGWTPGLRDDAAGNILKFQWSTSGVYKFKVDSSEMPLSMNSTSVGIGTTNPNALLAVAGDADIADQLAVGAASSITAGQTMRIAENFTEDSSKYLLVLTTTATSPTLTGDRTTYGIYSDVIDNKTEDTINLFDSDAAAIYGRVRNSGSYTFRALRAVYGEAYNDSDAASDLGSVYAGYFDAYQKDTISTLPTAIGVYSVARGTTGTAGPITDARGLWSEVYPYDAAIGTAYGAYNYVRTIDGYAGDITTAYGTYGRVRVDSDNGGNITTGKAGYFETSKRAGATDMTTAYGIHVDVNAGLTLYGIRADVDDIGVGGTGPQTSYGLFLDVDGAEVNNYGIYAEDGDWVLDADGNGIAGGTGPGGELILGEGQDLELYHDGTNSYIVNNTGYLSVGGTGSNKLVLQGTGGNVGIGTTNPLYNLDVNGDIYADGTIYGNISSASGTSTLNSLNLSTLTVTGATYLATTSGNVGIGTTAPAAGYKLDVQGSIFNTGDIVSYVSGGGQYIQLRGTAAGEDWVLKHDGAKLHIQDETVAGNEIMTFQSNGTIGIGTTAPAYLFHLLNKTAGNIAYFRDNSSAVDLTFGGSSPTFYIQSGSGDNLRLSANASTDPHLFINTLGNVGIGTTGPGAKLEIGSGQIFTPDGSDSAPSYSFTSDPDTGLRLQGTGNPLLVSGGGWGLRVNGAARVLHRTGGAGSPTYTHEDYSNTGMFFATGPTLGFSISGAEKMRIDINGNVGIGMTSPTHPLEVKSKGNDTGIKITSSDGSSQIFHIRQEQNTKSALFLYDTGSADVKITTRSDEPSYFNAGNNVGIGTISPLGLLQVGASPTPGLLVANSGNVGIGTTNPLYDLAVNGDIYADGTIYGNLAQGTVTPSGFTQGSVVFAGASGTLSQDNANLFWNDTDNRLGIGTTGPGAKLDVNGNVFIESVGELRKVTITNPGMYGGTQDVIAVGRANYTGRGFAIQERDAGGSVNSELTFIARNPSWIGTSGSRDLRLGANNTDIITLATSGNVGINYTDPGTAKLAVNGNVGIGTTGPAEKLEVNGNIIPSSNTYYLGTSTKYWDRLNLWDEIYFVGVSASTPLLHSYDNNTFNFSVGSNQALAFRVGTSEKVRIASNGNVGIGTTDPGVYKLKVQGTMYADNGYFNNSVRFEAGPNEAVRIGDTNVWDIEVTPLDRSNADGNLNFYNTANNIAFWRPTLWVYNAANYTTATAQSSGGLNFTNTGGHITFNPTGNFGIGTTGPGAKLEVSGGLIVGSPGKTPSSGQIAIENGIVTKDQSIYLMATGASNNWGLYWNTADSGVYQNSYEFRGNGTTRHALELGTGNAYFAVGSGNVGIGTTSPGALLDIQKDDGNIHFRTRGTGGNARLSIATDSSANVEMYTGNSVDLRLGVGTSPDDIVVKSSGNVGIGTTAPGAPLDVKGADSDNAYLARFYSNMGTRGSFIIRNGVAVNPTTYIGTGSSSEQLGIGTNNTERIRVKADGNVGIGTTDPLYELDVNGDIYSNATIYATNFVGGSSGQQGYWVRTGTTLKPTTATDDVTTLGDVGIGTTGPNTQLNIAKSTGQATLRLESGDNAGSIISLERFGQNQQYSWIETGANNVDALILHHGSPYNQLVLLPGGNVGIGTTGTEAKLDVSGTIKATNYKTANFLIKEFDASQLSLRNAADTADRILRLDALQITGGEDGGTAESIYFVSDKAEIVTSNADGRYLRFMARDTGVGSVEVARLQGAADPYFKATNLYSMYSGNVGIGTTGPNGKLDVRGGSFRVRANVVGAHYLDVTGTDGQGTTISDNYGWVRFKTGSGAAYDSLYLGGTGNVGIGTTDPSQKLDVTGNIVIPFNSVYGSHDSAADANFRAMLYKNTGGITELLSETNVVRINNANAYDVQLWGHSNAVGSSRTLLMQGTPSAAAGVYNNSPILDFRGYYGASSTAYNATLQHILSSTAPASYLTFNVGGSSNIMNIASNGNVGIGTIGPGSLLHLSKNDAVTNDVTNFLTVDHTSSATVAANFGSGIMFNLEDSAGNASENAASINAIWQTATSGSEQGAIFLRSKVAGGWSYDGNMIKFYRNDGANAGGGRIDFYDRGGAWRQSIYTSSWDFYITNTVNSSSRGIYIDATGAGFTSIQPTGTGPVLLAVGGGNVGIGAASPGALLHLQQNAAGATPAIIFDDNGGDSDFWMARNGTNDGTNNDYFQIGSGTTEGSSILFTINASGNVGIGTTSPLYTLDVSGDIYSDGTIFGNISSASGTSTLNSLNLSTLTVTGATYLATTSGSVGIGTTNPTKKLYLSGAYPYFVIDDTVQNSIFTITSGSGAVPYQRLDIGTINRDGSGFSPMFTLTSSGNFGMGWTDPGTAKLAVNGNVGIGTTAPGVRLQIGDNGTPNTASVIAIGQYEESSGESNLPVIQQKSVTGGNDLALAARSGNGAILFYAGGDSGTDFVPNLGSGNNAIRMIVENTGNVGIGTTAPKTALEVFSSGSISPTYFSGTKAAFLTNAATGNWARISVVSGDTGSSLLDLGDKDDVDIGRIRYNNGNDAMYFQTNNAEQMAILSTGNVGIGTASPGNYKLNVNGPAYILNDLTVGGAISGTNTGYIYFGDTNWQVGKDGGGSIRLRGYIANNGDKIGLQDATGNTYFLYGTKNSGVLEAHSAFPFFADATGTALTVPNGNVGFGTTAPTARLHVKDATGSKELFLEGTVNTGANLAGYKLYIDGYDNDDAVVADATYPIYTIDENSQVDFWTRSAIGQSANPTMYFRGNVGIGTTGPNAKLEVYDVAGSGIASIRLSQASGAASIWEMRSSDIYGSGGNSFGIWGGISGSEDTRLVIDASGYVGIGTTAPSSLLHLYKTGTSSQPKFTIEGYDPSVVVKRTDNTRTGLVYFTDAAGSTMLSIDQLSSVSRIRQYANVPIEFYTNNTFAVTIEETGNVGIGQATPQGKLHVYGVSGNQTTGKEAELLMEGGINHDVSGAQLNLGAIWFGHNENGGYRAAGIRGYAPYDFDVSSTPAQIIFLTTPSGSAVAQERMIIDHAGNVGIGTTNPLYELDVNGDIYSNATIYATNFVGGASGQQGYWVRTGTTLKPTTVTDNVTTLGSVGIGMTNPTYPLHIKTAGTNSQSYLKIVDGGSVNQFVLDSGVNGDARFAMYDSNGANTIAFNANSGSSNHFISSIGIGKSAPSGKLQVVGDEVRIGDSGTLDKASSDGDLYVEDELEVDGKAYMAGNVGIGTTNPTSALHVRKDDTNPIATFANTNTSGTGNGVLINLSSESGTDNYLLNVVGNAASKFYIQELGNVGIGTTNPGYLLSVSGSQTVTPTTGNGLLMIENTNNTLGNVAALVFKSTEGSNNRRAQISGGYDTVGPVSASGFLAFTTRYDDATFGERMRINYAGNVGIGSTNPLAKLEVSGGDLKVSGSIYESGTTLSSRYAPLSGGSNYVQLQGSTPGTQQTGNLNISNKGIFGGGIGWGSAGATLSTDQGAAMEFRGTGSPYMDWSNDGSIDFDVRLQLNGDDVLSVQGGNFGINETSPASFLAVKGGVAIGETTDYSQKAAPTGGMIVKGSVGIGTTNPTWGKLEVDDATPFAGQNAGNVSIWMRNSSVPQSWSINNKASKFIIRDESNAADLFTVVNSFGYVGIGTTGPGGLLHVKGDKGSVNYGQIKAEGVNSDAVIQIDAPVSRISTLQFEKAANVKWQMVVTENSNDFQLWESNTPKFYVKSGGSIGIGTTDPLAKLHTMGEIRAAISDTSDIIRLLPQAAGSGASILTSNAADTGRTPLGIDSSLLKFLIHSSEKMRLDGAGNFGIGTTNPSALLHVATSAAQNNVAMNLDDGGRVITIANRGDWSGDQDGALDIYNKKMVILSGGNVGIGTTGPLYKLDINGTRFHLGTGDTGAYLEEAGSSAIYLAGGASYNSWVGEQYVYTAKNATAQGIAMENGQLRFWSNSSLGVGSTFPTTERLRISSNGNVGIGITTPTGNLHVYQNAPAANQVLLRVSTNGDTSRFSVDEDGDVAMDGSATIGGDVVVAGGDFYDNSGDASLNGEDSVYIKMDHYNNDVDATSTNAIIFAKNTNVGAGVSGPNELLRITEAGNVGIGTTNPLYDLDVNGDIYANGTIYGNISAGGGGTITLPSFTLGSVIFAGTGGTLSQDNANFFWDDSGNKLGIGTTGPDYKLQVYGGANLDNYIAVTSGYGKVAGIYLGPDNAAGFASIRADATLDKMIFNLSNLDVMAINKTTGNVGIGTTGPQSALEIRNDTNELHEIRLSKDMDSATASAQLSFYGFNNAQRAWIGIKSGLNNLRINSPQSDGIITFWPANTEKVRIDSAGNVGIGTTGPKAKLDLGNSGGSVFVLNPGSAASPTYTGFAHNDLIMGSYVSGGYSNGFISTGYTSDVNRKFHIGSANSATFDGSTAFVPAFTVTSGGNVGIGTTGPNYKLHIDSANRDHMAWSRSGTTWYLDMANNSWSIAQGGTAWFEVTTGGKVSINDDSTPDAQLEVSASGGANDLLMLSSNDNTDGDKFIVKNSGNVGIGTTSPGGKLHVFGSMNGANGNPTYRGDLIIERTSATGSQSTGGIEFKTDAYTNGYGWKITPVDPDTDALMPLIFSSRNNSASWTDVMAIQRVGNVGIGTTNPKGKLNVYGNKNIIDTDSIGAVPITATGGAVVDINSTYFGEASNGAELRDGVWIGTSYNLNDTDASGHITIGRGEGTVGVDRTEKLSHILYWGDYMTLVPYNGTLRLAQYPYNSTGYVDFAIANGDLTVNTGGDNVTFSDPVTLSSSLTVNGAFSPSTLTVSGASYLATTSGNVGIGMTSPNNKLEIRSTTTPQARIAYDTSNYATFSVGSNGQMTIDQTGSSASTVFPDVIYGQSPIYSYQGSDYLGIDHTGAFGKLFTTSGSTNKDIQISPGDSPVMTIKSDGSVGIGTTNPNHKLEVVGNIMMGGDYGSFTTVNDTIYLGHQRKFLSTATGVNVDGSTDWLNLLAHPSSKGIILGTSGTADATPHDAVNAHVVIQAGGNVGIGTTAPSKQLELRTADAVNAQLAITATNAAATAGLDLQAKSGNSAGLRSGLVAAGDFVTYVNGSTWAQYINTSGNVGIGTTNPMTKLNVEGGTDVILTTANTGYTIIGNPASAHIAIDANEIMAKATGTTGATLYLQAEGGTTTLGGPIVTTTIDTGLGANEVYPMDQNLRTSDSPSFTNLTVSSQLNAAGLKIHATDALSRTTSGPIYLGYENTNTLYFGTGASGTTMDFRSNALQGITTLTTSGNVGIGTTAPNAKLEAYKAGSAANDRVEAARFTRPAYGGDSFGGGPYISLQNYDVVVGGMQGLRELNGWNGALAFYTHTSSSGNTWDTTITEKMRISSDGKVGIGNTAPSEKLDIKNPNNADDTSIKLSSGDYWYYITNEGSDGAVRYRSDDARKQIFKVRQASTYRDALTVDYSGNVGVGITAPGATLHVKNPENGLATLTLESSYSGTTTPVSLITDNPGGIMSLVIQKGAGYRPAGYVNLMTIDMNGNTNITGSLTAGSFSPSTLSVSGNSYLATTSGNVGIGTTGPLYKLDIKGDSLYTFRIDNSNSASALFADLAPQAGQETYLRFLDGTADAKWSIRKTVNNHLWLMDNVNDQRFMEVTAGATDLVGFINSNVGIGNSSPVGKLHVGTSPGQGLLIVASNGNVGIGTTAPGAKLDIEGGNLDMSNNEIDNINYLDIRNAAGYGLRFWSNNDYKVHMGNAAEYKYGPVTDYSIKMNMSNTAGRGWTWGVNSSTPVAALSKDGVMQIASNFYSLGNVGIGTTGPITKLEIGEPFSGVTSGWGADVRQGILIGQDSDNVYFGLDDEGGNYDHGTIVFGDDTNDIFTFQRNDASGNKTELVTIKYDGNVGIGTTGPNRLLHISRTDGDESNGIRIDNLQNGGYGSGISIYGKRSDTGAVTEAVRIQAVGENSWASDGTTATQLRFYTINNNAFGERIRVMANGSVGIGTSNPGAALAVGAGGDGTGAFKVTTAGVITASGGTSTNWNTAYGWGNHATAGYISDGNTNWDNSYGFITSESDPQVGTISTNYVPKWNGSALVTGTIYDNGNVGVGTTAPLSPLEVRDQSAVQTTPLVLRNEYGTGADLKTVGMAFRGGNGNWATIYGGQQNTNDWNFGRLMFGTRTSDALGVETKMTILANGNVGIGTTGPREKLEVSGNIAAGDGSASAPSYTFGSEKDVGMYRIGTNTLGFSGGGVGTLALDNNAVYVEKDLILKSASGYAIYGDDNAGSNLILRGTNHATKGNVIIADDGGKVGIGITSPAVGLHIGTTASSHAMTANNDLLVSGKLEVDGYSYFDSNIYIADNMNIKMGNGAFLGTLNTDNNYYLIHARDNGVGMVEVGRVAGAADPYVSFGGSQQFKFYNSGTADFGGSIYFTSGNVGIGTTGPVAKLHSKGPSAVPSNNGKGNLFVEGGDYFGLGIGSYGASPWGAWLQVADTSGGGTYPLILNPNGGNVGIGTTGPTNNLHLASGEMRIKNGYIDSEWPDSVNYRFLTVGSSYYNGSNFITNGGTAWGSNYVSQIGLEADGKGIVFYTQPSTGNTQRTDTAATFNTYERMRIDQTGKVGIGTTGPARRLDVASDGSNWVSGIFAGAGGTDKVTLGNSGGGAIVGAQNSALSAWSTLYVNTDPTLGGSKVVMAGNVGIGATTPHGILEVKASAPQLWITDTSSTGPLIGFDINNNGVLDGGIGYNRSAGNVMQFYTNGTAAANTRMYISQNGNVGIGTGTVNPVGLLQAGSGPTPGLIVTGQNGNVGIGTTGPGTKLQIDPGSSTALGTSVGLRIGAGSGVGALHQIGFGWRGSTNPFAIISGVEENDSGPTYGGILFATRATGSGDVAPTEKVRIDTAGNVGIGTTSPLSKLHMSMGDAFADVILITDTTQGAGLKNWYLGGSVGSSDLEIGSANDTMGQRNPAIHITKNASGVPNLIQIQNGPLNAVNGIGIGSGVTSPVGFLQVGPSPTPFVVTSTGNVGIGMTDPGNYKLYVNGTSYFNGQLTVTNLNKLAGSFMIDHPLDPENKVLRHSFTESPDMKNFYDGVVVLNENGESIVNLPDWFEALNKDFRYQLTPVGKPAMLYIKEEVKGNKFVIAGGEPGMKVSWQVTGIRQDTYANKHRIVVEEEKGKDGVTKEGEYLCPDCFTKLEK